MECSRSSSRARWPSGRARSQSNPTELRSTTMKNDHRELERTEATAQEVEPTRERPRIAPLADVYETDANFVLVADMPGVDETSVEVTLQNRVLQITGQVKPRQHEGYRRVYAEFDDADYERAFQI